MTSPETLALVCFFKTIVPCMTQIDLDLMH
jgi:hypothetical protein